VDAEESGDFLTVWKKGDRGYNYETQKHFTFAIDAVEAIIFEKGRFRAIVTGD
jgi:hypothetical protein